MKPFHKIIIRGAFLFFLALLPSLVFALEIKYPVIKIGERVYTITKETELPELAVYVYYFILGLGGISAFAMIAWGGIRYLTSAGNLGITALAKKQISGSFLGLVILLLSFLILATINPQLVILKPIKPVPPAGITPPVYEISEGVIAQTTVKEDPYKPIYGSIIDLTKLDLKDKIEKFIFKDTPETKYAIILFEKPNFKGSCRFLNNDESDALKNIEDFQFSSIRLILQPSQSFYQKGEGVRLFKNPYKETPSWWQLNICNNFIFGNKIVVKETGWSIMIRNLLCSPPGWPRAFQIEGKGKYLALFTKKEDFQGVCQAFDVDIDDLGKAYPEASYYPEDLGYDPRSLILLQTKFIYK